MARSWDDPKDPEELLDYVCDWSKPLAGDTILASAWDVPDGIVNAGNQSFTDTTTTIWLSGGTHGKNYDLVNRINTLGGRIREQTCTLRVRTK